VSPTARPLRVAVVHSIRHFGSTETYLLELLRRADRERVEWSLVIPDDPVLAPLRELDGVHVVALPDDVYRTAFHATRAVRRALRAIAPDVVHALDVDPPAMLAALSLRRPLVVTHHTPELRPPYNAVGRALRGAGWATRPYVIFTSERDRERFGGRRSTTIPLGIDLERFAPRAGDGRVRRELGLADGTPLVGTVGLLKEQKRHDLLVSAAEVVDAAFVIVGDGPLRRSLEWQIETFGLGDRVHLLGHRDDVPAVLADLDVFALSSDYEGMCLAVAEALAVGTPVVATEVGGVPQTVVHEETGLLVRPGDPEALANSIRRLLDDPREARRLADAGGERVRRLYPLDGMVAATVALYERLAA